MTPPAPRPLGGITLYTAFRCLKLSKIGPPSGALAAATFALLPAWAKNKGRSSGNVNAVRQDSRSMDKSVVGELSEQALTQRRDADLPSISHHARTRALQRRRGLTHANCSATIDLHSLHSTLPFCPKYSAFLNSLPYIFRDFSGFASLEVSYRNSSYFPGAMEDSSKEQKIVTKKRRKIGFKSSSELSRQIFKT